MHKTQWIDLKTTVIKTAVSWFSVMLFVVLGIALFIGLGWGSMALERTADAEFHKYHLHDLEVIFPYGAAKEDLSAIEETEGVSRAEETRYTDRYFLNRGEKSLARVRALTKEADLLSRVSGRLPEKEDEIALQKDWAEKNGYAVGDTISFEESEDVIEPLKKDTFTVTALAESHAYMAKNSGTWGVSEAGSVPLSCIMFVHPDAFADGLSSGGNDVLIESGALSGLLFNSEEYKTGSRLLKDRLQEKLDDDAVILTREDNGGVVFTEDNAAGSKKLRYSMASLLVILGFMVCYSAVTRLVQDQQILIGTRKALGFTEREITGFYLLYTGSAAFLGSLLGILAGRFILEPVVLSEMKKNFILESCEYLFSWKEALIMAAIEIVLLLISTALACRRVLRRNAAELLSGSAAQRVRHRFFEKCAFWQKLSLLSKTVVTNFFQDKRRVFATLTGIAGCTALIACGVSFSNSIKASAPYHYEHLQKYDTVLYYDGREETKTEIRKLTDRYGFAASAVSVSSGQFTMADGKHIASRLIVTDEKSLAEVFTLKDEEGLTHPLSEGPWISLPMAKACHISAGDKVKFTDGKGKEHEITVGGVCEYYLSDLAMFMDKETAKREMGTDGSENAFLLDTGGADLSGLHKELNRVEGYLLTYDFKGASMVFVETINSSFLLISFLYLGMSVAMAFLVLLNLQHTFVKEKERELVIMMINGYGRDQVKKYIYADTVFLSVIGIPLGLFAGIFISRLSIDAVSGPTMYFIHEINVPACLISALVTAGLTFLMTLLSLREVDRMPLDPSQA